MHYITTAVELYRLIVWSNPKSDLPDFILGELLSEKIPSSLSVKANIWNNDRNYPLELSSIYFKSGFSNLNLLHNLWRMEIYEKNAENSITVFRYLILKHAFPCDFTMLIKLASFPGACQLVYWHMPVNQMLMAKNKKGMLFDFGIC